MDAALATERIVVMVVEMAVVTVLEPVAVHSVEHRRLASIVVDGAGRRSAAELEHAVGEDHRADTDQVHVEDVLYAMDATDAVDVADAVDVVGVVGGVRAMDVIVDA